MVPQTYSVIKIRECLLKTMGAYSYSRIYKIGPKQQNSIYYLLAPICMELDLFEEVSIFVVWLGRFAPFAK